MIVNENRRQMQSAAIEAAEKSGYNCIILAVTGLGKAWILIECLKRVNPKGRIIYACDSQDNRDKTFRDELIKWGAEEYIERIEFMCYQSAYKLEGEEIDLLLADEFDVSMSPKYSRFYFNNSFKNKVMVTATLEEKKRRVAEKIAPIVYETTLSDISGKEILNESEYNVVNFMLTKEENLEYLKFNAKFVKILSEHKSAWRDKRMEMLTIARKQFLSSLESSRAACRKLLKELYQDENNKILIFCGLSEQADKICKYSYHSKSEDDNLSLFDKGDIRVLSVVNRADRGINLKGVNTVIFEAPGKSKTRFQQRQGRSKRLQVDEISKVYFLIPWYRKKYGDQAAPTIAHDWMMNSVSGMNIKLKTYKLKEDV